MAGFVQKIGYVSYHVVLVSSSKITINILYMKYFQMTV